MLKRNLKCMFLALILAVSAMAPAMPGGAVFAADNDPIISAFTYSDTSVVVNLSGPSGTNLTLTAPYSYVGDSLDLLKLNWSIDFSKYNWLGRNFSANQAAFGAPGLPGATVSMVVEFTINADPDPKTTYTTTYNISAVKLAPIEATYTGTVEKTYALQAAQYAFAPDDFSKLYKKNDSDPLTGITIIGPGGPAGQLYVGDAPYALGMPIAAADLPNVRFKTLAAGALTFDVYAHNAADLSSAPKIGKASLKITVSTQTGPTPSPSPSPSPSPRPSSSPSPSPSPRGYLDEIYYEMSWNDYIYIDDSDINSAFRQLTGRNVNYIQLSQPSSSNGRLYYNYTSSSSYDYQVSSSNRFYRDSSPWISDVAFVPASDYTGTVTIRYTAYDSNSNAYDGTIRVRVDTSGSSGSSGANYNYAYANTVTYSVGAGATVFLSAADFNSSLVTATGHSLSNIRFLSLPSSGSGRFQYNYNGTSTTYIGYGSVSTDTRYYMNSSPSISGISFVPNANYKGTISISYNAYATNGSAYGGTLFMRIGQTSSAYALSDIKYSVKKNTTVKLATADFQAALQKQTYSSLSYIMINEAPTGGTLYYNYRGASDYDSAVTVSARYYSGSNPNLSQITFVPKPSQTGSVTIPYTAYAVNGVAYNGKIIVSIAASGSLTTLNYSFIYGDPISFSDIGVEDDIYDAVRAAAGAKASSALSYVVFAVPPPSAGTLYKNYASSARQRQSIAADEEFSYGKSPAIDSLTLTVGSESRLQLSYTAYTASGDAYDGKITFKPTILPAGWARDEVVSLMSRGVAPAELLAGYESPITRAEFTALLMRAYDYSGAATNGGGSAGGAREAAFTDISVNKYRRLITRAYSLSIIDGESESRFNPDASLTREEAAKILCTVISRVTGAAIEAAEGLPYEDRKSISVWALPFVEYAYVNGLMIGDAAGMFRPGDSISREEALALVERMIVKYKLG